MPCEIRRHSQNTSADRQATDWLPPTASVRGTLCPAALAGLSAHRGFQEGSRNSCLHAPPDRAPRPDGTRQLPSPARTASRPTVREEMWDVMRFWLEMGVDA